MNKFYTFAAEKKKYTNIDNMQNSHSKSIIPILVFLFSGIYLLMCSMQCFDLADEGFFLSACQQYGTDISYAKCGSGYPLSCYLGWLLYSIMPSGGILMMRLWGILIIIATEIIAFFYLRKSLPKLLLITGLLLQVILLGGDSRVFGYNTLTAFFGMLSFLAIVKGVERDCRVLQTIGGLLLGGTVFIRLPNVAFLVFLIIPFINRLYKEQKRPIVCPLIQTLWILVGLALGISIAWMLLHLIGADRQVLDFFAQLVNQLNDTTNTHNANTMIDKLKENYYLSLLTFIYFILSIRVASIAFRSRFKLVHVIGVVIAFLIVYKTTYMSSNLFGDRVIALMNGIGIIGSCYYLSGTHEQRNMALGAIMLSLLCPFGSDRGFQTVWNGLWLALPVGISGIYKMISELKIVISSSGIQIASGHNFVSGNVTFTGKHFNKAFKVSLASLAVAVVSQTEIHGFFDPEFRYYKTTPIKSPMSKGIYTASYKAERVNPLLEQLPKFIKPNDVLLVYDFSPMIYFLTQTRPYAGISWPCMYYGKRYMDAIKQAEQHEQQLPVVVVQYFLGTNDWWWFMDDYMTRDYCDSFTSPEVNRFVLNFLEEHHYKQIWSNNYYRIFLPPRKT